jgi:hypothetical protein
METLPIPSELAQTEQSFERRYQGFEIAPNATVTLRAQHNALIDRWTVEIHYNDRVAVPRTLATIGYEMLAEPYVRFVFVDTTNDGDTRAITADTLGDPVVLSIGPGRYAPGRVP